MKITTRFRKLTLWNKLGAIGAAASIIALVLGIVFYLSPPKAPGPVDVEKIISPYKAQLRQSELREEKYQSQIKALTEAVTALANERGKPGAPKGINEALAELAKGQPQAAERIFQEILIRKSAGGKEAYKEAAAAARHLGALAFLTDTHKAIDAYRKAVELDPDEAEGWNKLGHLLTRIGDVGGAEKAYQKVKQIG